MNKKVDLLIQIVNYKTTQLLKKCLSDVHRDLSNSDISYHIAIVDNNSGDIIDDFSDTKVSIYY